MNRHGDRVVRWVIGLVGLSVVSWLWALDGQRQFNQLVRDLWSVEQGLPQDHVVDLLQTRDGFLWIATQEGLVRFDGAVFENWAQSAVPRLAGREVRTLAETRNGDLWVGTNRGLFTLSGAYRRQVNEFEALSKVGISAMCLAGPGEMWVGGDNGELFFVGAGDVRRIAEGEGPDPVNAIVLDGEGGVWVGRTSGLYRCDGRSLTPVALPDLNRRVSVHDIKRDPRGRLWFTTSAGLLRNEAGAFAWVGRDQPVLERRLRAVELAGSGLMWLAGERALYRFDWREETPHFEKRPEGDYAQVLYADRDGNMWLGYYHSGLVRFRNGRVVSYGADQGLRNTVVRCTLTDARGQVWFGTDGGLGCKTEDGMRWYGEEEGFPGNLVLSLAEEPATGAIWIGYDNGTVRRLDENGARDISPLSRWHKGHTIRAMKIEPGTQKMWVGGSRGLTVFDMARGQIVWERSLPGALSALCFEEHHVWLGTSAGLLRLSTDGGGEGESALDDVFVTDILPDQDGVVWVATYGNGLYRIQAGRTFALTTDQGLIDNKLFRILQDRDGFFWLSSNRGVWRVARRDLNQVVAGTRTRVEGLLLNERHGMVTAECNGGTQPAGMKTPDGDLWFPTVAGLVRIDPDRVVVAEAPVTPVLVGVRVDGKDVFPDQRLTLAGDVRRVEIRFSAAQPTFTEPPMFRARLTGPLHRDLPISERRSVFLSALPEGTYHLTIQQDNEPHATPMRLNILVRGDFLFWRMRWYLPLLVGFLVLGGGLFLVRREHLARQRLTASIAAGQRELRACSEQQSELNQVMVQRFHYAGMAEIGMSVLQNVDQTLNRLDQYTRGLKRGISQTTGVVGLRQTAERLDQRLAQGRSWSTAEAAEFIDEFHEHRRDLVARWEDQIDQVVLFRELVHQVCGLVEAQQQYAKLNSFEETVDLNIVVEDVCRIKQSILLENQVALIQDLKPVPLVRVPKARLMQVLVLLVRCGRKSLEPIGEDEIRKLMITTRSSSRHEVKVQIGFSGVGYSLEELQALAGEPDLDSLAGLDFALCRRLLAGFSGSLQVETSTADRTAFLSLVLPVETEIQE